MIWFPLCLFVSPYPYVSASIPDPFVWPLPFWLTYISLVCHVCFLSSYINFDLTSTVTLCLHATWVFHLTVLPPLETAWLLQLRYSSSCASGNLPASSFNLAASLRLVGHAYTTYLWNTWTTTEGWHSAWAEATVHTPHRTRKPTRPSLRTG